MSDKRKKPKIPTVATKVLTETQMGQLREMNQPLVRTWETSVAGIRGYLIAAGFPVDARYSIDVLTGIVTMVQQEAISNDDNT